MAEGAEGGAAWWDVPYTPDGSDPECTRFLRLHAAPEPIPEGGVHATVVVMHGGYWKNQFGLGDPYGNAGTASMAPFFLSCGFAAVELEYRRRDHDGGGWPGTNEDILLAVARLAELQLEADGGSSGVVDPRRVAAVRALSPDRLLLVGHSAGGCLALWAGHQLAEHGLQMEPQGPAAAPAPPTQPPLPPLDPTAAPSAGLQLRMLQRLVRAAPLPGADARARKAAAPTGDPFIVEADIVNVREEPSTDANKVGVLGRGESVCGELRDGWLHLDEASSEAHGLVAATGAYVLADGGQLGLGQLLRPSTAAAACVARRRRWRRGARAQAAAVLALAPVADLVRGHEMRISDDGDAVERYMGAPPCEASREDYARASPAELLPVSFPVLVGFGSDDKDVPPDLMRGYAQAALEGAPERVSVVEVPGADHFDVVNAKSTAWLEQIVPTLAAIAEQELSEAAAAALLGAAAEALGSAGAA